MKKLIIIIISTLILVSCKNIEPNTKTESPTNSISAVLDKDDYSNSQNDLVYHDYGTGIKLSNNSSFIIQNLNLNLNGETAYIYVINLENSEVFKICDYLPLQDVLYTPDSDGVYKIIAEISNGDIVDLTPKATIETSCIEKNGNGIILL